MSEPLIYLDPDSPLSLQNQIRGKLVELLTETNQEVPAWIQNYAAVSALCACLAGLGWLVGSFGGGLAWIQNCAAVSALCACLLWSLFACVLLFACSAVYRWRHCCDHAGCRATQTGPPPCAFDPGRPKKPTTQKTTKNKNKTKTSDAAIKLIRRVHPHTAAVLRSQLTSEGNLG